MKRMVYVTASAVHIQRTKEILTMMRCPASICICKECGLFFMVTTVHQRYQSLYFPTNAHNVKHVELLKYIKIMETAPAYFGLQRNHHQEATAST